MISTCKRYYLPISVTLLSERSRGTRLINLDSFLITDKLKDSYEQKNGEHKFSQVQITVCFINTLWEEDRLPT